MATVPCSIAPSPEISVKSSPVKPTPRISDEAAARIALGSKHGSNAVSQEFASVLTRKRLSKAIGVHEKTLLRWEKAGVIKPHFKMILGTRTATFDEAEIRRGRRIAALVQGAPGALSLRQAAAIADSESH